MLHLSFEIKETTSWPWPSPWNICEQWSVPVKIIHIQSRGPISVSLVITSWFLILYEQQSGYICCHRNMSILFNCCLWHLHSDVELLVLAPLPKQTERQVRKFTVHLGFNTVSPAMLALMQSALYSPVKWQDLIMFRQQSLALTKC